MSKRNECYKITKKERTFVVENLQKDEKGHCRYEREFYLHGFNNLEAYGRFLIATGENGHELYYLRQGEMIKLPIPIIKKYQYCNGSLLLNIDGYWIIFVPERFFKGSDTVMDVQERFKNLEKIYGKKCYIRTDFNYKNLKQYDVVLNVDGEDYYILSASDESSGPSSEDRRFYLGKATPLLGNNGFIKVSNEKGEYILETYKFELNVRTGKRYDISQLENPEYYSEVVQFDEKDYKNMHGFFAHDVYEYSDGYWFKNKGGAIVRMSVYANEIYSADHIFTIEPLKPARSIEFLKHVNNNKGYNEYNIWQITYFEGNKRVYLLQPSDSFCFVDCIWLDPKDLF